MTARQLVLEVLAGLSLAAIAALVVASVTFTVISLLTVLGARGRDRRRRRLVDLDAAFDTRTLAALDERLEQLLGPAFRRRPADLHYRTRRNSH